MANSREDAYCPMHTPSYSESDAICRGSFHFLCGTELNEADVVWQAAATRKANIATKKWSTPLNIPDWSKIICMQKSRRMSSEEEYSYYYDEDEEKGGFMRTPPHEFVAKRMANATSFSVHEGVGRTLKGRDLSMLRNAIWEKTGFLD